MGGRIRDLESGGLVDLGDGSCKYSCIDGLVRGLITYCVIRSSPERVVV